MPLPSNAQRQCGNVWHWDQAAQLGSLPFDITALARPFDTEPLENASTKGITVMGCCQ